MIRVAVVAPNLALRAGLRVLLAASESIQVTAEASRLNELEPERGGEIDVIVVAVSSGMETSALAHGAGFEDWAALNPGTACLILTDDLEASGAASLSRSAGSRQAWGILPLDSAQEELLAAVAGLHEGLVVAAPHLLAGLLQPAPDPAPSYTANALPTALTEREAEVLQLLAQGLANKQIALSLKISEHTVKFHVSSIYSKLEVVNRTEAVRKGARLGLIVF